MTLPSVGHEAIVDACMHHFDLHQERLINFTIDEDSFWVVRIMVGAYSMRRRGGRGPSYVV